MTKEENVWLDEATVSKAWQELLDKDDRTSPEEYLEMCLITRDEVAALLAARPPSPVSYPLKVNRVVTDEEIDAAIERTQPRSFAAMTSAARNRDLWTKEQAEKWFSTTRGLYKDMLEAFVWARVDE